MQSKRKPVEDRWFNDESGRMTDEYTFLDFMGYDMINNLRTQIPHEYMRHYDTFTYCYVLYNNVAFGLHKLVSLCTCIHNY